MIITKQMLEEYEKVCSWGTAFEYNVGALCKHAGLKEEEVIYIKEHYEELKQKRTGEDKNG